VTSFEQSSEEIAAPAFSNETDFRAFFASFAKFWTAYSNASSESGLMEVAIEYRMPELCGRMSNFSSCIDAYTAMARDPNACPLLSGDEQDKCWYYFGTYIAGKDPKYCANIANETIRLECLGNESAETGGVEGNNTAAGNATAQNSSND
jgi:hypothetical protein